MKHAGVIRGFKNIYKLIRIDLTFLCRSRQDFNFYRISLNFAFTRLELFSIFVNF